MNAMNPLLSPQHFPAFSAIQPEHVEPAISTLLGRCRETLVHVSAPQVKPTWQNVVVPLQEAHRTLSRAWSCVGNLNAVTNSPEIRAAHQEQLPKITAYFTEVAQNEALYAKYKAIRESDEFNTLSTAQKKLLKNELRDFVLGGAELQGSARARFAAIAETLATLSAQFSDNVLDAMNAWSVTVDASRVAGIPADVLTTAAEKAKAKDSVGYLFSLHMPSYLPVMQYAQDRSLREQLYRAFTARASDQFKVGDAVNAQWDNAPLIAQILALKEEEAKLLGYKNFAEVSLVPKMAQTPPEVIHFLRDLAARAKPFAEKDMADLRAFAKAHLGLETLEAWDIPYASEQLQQQRYAYSDLELQQYLPEDKVLAGLYRVIESLYSVKIIESKADVWHPHVRFFAVKNSVGLDVGHFYLDLYARENKQGGAWADSVNNRAKLSDGDHTPLVFLTCNLPAPVNGKPALFTHNDVITIFHEFGHGLHVLLSQVEQQGISGWDGVEWDAVELPSQFMENYCYEWDVLQHITAHAETGAPLPRAFYDKVVAAKNFQSGMQTLRQIEFGLFDMRIHSEFSAVGETAPQRMLALLEEVRREVAVVPYPASNRMPMSFSHIFAGGYAAGYYSYLWAEVLSADAYGAFEEEGVLSEKTGKRFLDEVIGRGGTRSAIENFEAFRGRKPSMDALLRHSGMNN
jgi:oligopeptidase A